VPANDPWYRRREYVGRLLALTLWGYAAWALLTWTATVEYVVAGVVVAAVCAVALAPLGPVAPPCALLRPRRLAVLPVLLAQTCWHVLLANVSLARRIWSPRRPLASGMVVVPTGARSDAGLATVGILTSLVVDNQVLDVDRDRHELLYHCVEVPPKTEGARYRAVNGTVEHRLEQLEAL
jgi:multicomponent Na+:H+ antiporter subunit E